MYKGSRGVEPGLPGTNPAGGESRLKLGIPDFKSGARNAVSLYHVFNYLITRIAQTHTEMKTKFKNTTTGKNKLCFFHYDSVETIFRKSIE